MIEPLTHMLDEAKELTEHIREAEYGSAEVVYDLVADFWGNYLQDTKLDTLGAKDVMNMMMLLKLAREKYKHKRDNLVDIAGYANLGHKIEKNKVIHNHDHDVIRELKEENNVSSIPKCFRF